MWIMGSNMACWVNINIIHTVVVILGHMQTIIICLSPLKFNTLLVTGLTPYNKLLLVLGYNWASAYIEDTIKVYIDFMN